jgi:hypothetical protein
LDVEHLWKYTLRDAPLGDVLARIGEFFTQFGGKLRHIHMPGYLPYGQEHRPMYCSRDLVLRMFSLLAERGFEGFVVSESDPEFQTVHELRMDVLLFEAWRERHERRVPAAPDVARVDVPASITSAVAG